MASLLRRIHRDSSVVIALNLLVILIEDTSAALSAGTIDGGDSHTPQESRRTLHDEADFSRTDLYCLKPSDIIASLNSIDTIESCSLRCLSANGCEAFSYVGSNGTCTLGAAVTDQELVGHRGWAEEESVYMSDEAEVASCDRQDGWYPIAVEQKCWKLFPAAVQRDAVRRCEDAGAELIVFQSQEKIDAFGDLVQDSSTGFNGDGQGVWSSGEQIDGIFIWPDGTNVTLFAPNEPNGNGQCVQIPRQFGHPLDDYPCNLDLEFICEKDV